MARLLCYLCALWAALPGRLPAQTPDTVLTLDGALSLLEQRNPEYRAALAGADATAEGVWQARGAFLPTLSASASFFRNDFTNRTFLDPTGISRELEDPVESTSKSASQSLSLGWQAFDGGRRLFDLRAARADTRSAQLAAHATLVRLRSALRQAYYDALEQQELLRLARELLAARRRELEIARTRFRIAAVARTDVLQAEIRVGAQELAVFRTEQALAAARRELSGLLDLDESTSYRLRAESTAFDPTEISVTELLGRARRSHPELGRLDADIQAGSQRLWSARGNWWPTVTLNLNWGRSEQLGPEGEFFTFDPRNTSTSLSLSLNWDLVNGLQKKWQTGAAAARLQETRHRRQETELRLEKEIRNTHQALVTAHRSLELQSRNAERARELVRLSTERYRIGAAGYVELQQATTQATEAERGLIEARYEFLATFARLQEAVGGTIEPPTPSTP